MLHEVSASDPGARGSSGPPAGAPSRVVWINRRVSPGPRPPRFRGRAGPPSSRPSHRVREPVNFYLFNLWPRGSPQPTATHRDPPQPTATHRRPTADKPQPGVRWVAVGCAGSALGLRWVCGGFAVGFRWVYGRLRMVAVCRGVSRGSRWVAVGCGDPWGHRLKR